MSSNAPLQVYRGTMDNINSKLTEIEDGRLIFAVDSKQIYLDYDVDNSPFEGPTRIKFGGSTGIWYGKKENVEDSELVVFSLNELEDANEYPSPKDLILNTDGSFYKVKEVFEATDQILALRLTVSGVGGGGPSSGSGYIEYSRIGPKTRYFSANANEMPITFVGSTTAEYATLGATIYLIDVAGVQHTIGTIQTLTPSMDKENPIIIDLKPYLEKYGYKNNTSYNIEILLEDDAGNTAFNTIPYTVTIFNMYIEKIKDIGASAVDSSFFCRPVFYTGLSDIKLHSKTTHLTYQTVQEEKYIQLTNASNGEQSVIDVLIASKNYPIGSYKIEVWLSAIAEGIEVTSEILTSTFIVTSVDSSDPQIVLNEPTKTSYKQYESINLEYFIAYNNDTINVIQEVYYTDPYGNITVSEETYNQATKTNLVWAYRFMKLGTYRFVIYAGTNKLVKVETINYTIKEASGDIPTFNTSGLALSLTADKTNESLNRDTWTSTGSNIVNCTFNDNFNWISNGWMTEEDGAQSLYLNNGAVLEVPYYPFTGSAITQTGLTVELDVKISNIRNRKSRIISGISESEDGVLYSGIVVNGDFFTLNNSSQKPIEEYEKNGEISLATAGMTSTYVEGKRVRITWVIAPVASASKLIASNMIYTYVNGVMSGFVDYQGSSFGKASKPNEISNKFVFDSTDADINIYGMRAYITPLTDRAVLNNYFASFADFTEAARRWEDNALLNDDTLKLDVLKVIEAGNDPNKKDQAIPYILMRGGCGVTDKDGKTFNYEGTGNTLVTRLPEGKKDYRLVDFCFIDPADSSKNIGSLASSDRVEATIYAQGTSSMDYPIKNLRMVFARDNEEQTYQLFEHIPPVNLFCHKVDYMESSSAHNTGLGNIVNDLYGNIKPPSRLIHDTYTQVDGENTTEVPLDYVTAIKGRPIVIFFKETLTDPRELRESEDDYTGYTFIGRYNFNLDKSTHEPFGFYSDVNRHYGVAIQDPPALDDNYEQNLVNTTILDGFHATFDKNPIVGKKYYHKPIEDDAYLWSAQELSDLSKGGQWQSYVAYEKVNANDGINSIQVWECLNNNLPLTHFQTDWYEQDTYNEKTKMWENTWDIKNEEWTTAFEARYPEYEYQGKSDKRELQRLVNWLHDTDCAYFTERQGEQLKDEEGNLKFDEDNNPIYEIIRDCHIYPKEPTLEEIEKIISGEMETVLTPLFPDENGNPSLIGTTSNGTKQYKTDEYGYIYNSYDYRLKKFENEFDQYFESDLTMVYYILTEFLLMTDSRAKNMMLCTFTANCLNSDGTSATKWFPILYDMDTGLGVNNMGQLKFSYKDEDYFSDVFNAEAGYYDQLGNINSSYSTIFTNIRLTMYDRLKTVYSTMRKGAFNYQTMLNAYNTNQADRWNETYINQDAYLKYVEPLINNSPWKVMVDAAQGTRSLNREQFLRRRFLYMDGKYAYVDTNSGFSYRLYSRLVDPKNIYQYTVTTKDAMYWISAINKNNIIRGDRLEENSTITIQPHAANSNTGEQEFYIYIPENIVSLGNLSSIGIQNWDPYGTSVVEENILSMRELNLSTNQPGWEYGLKLEGRMTQLDMVENFPMLETLNVGYWNGLAQLDLRNNPNLKSLYAYGTVLNQCQFPEGGILENIELPTTLTDIKLQGHYHLEKIGYRYYESGWDLAGGHLSGTVFNQDYFDEHVVIKDDAWEYLLKLSIKQCPNLDTKFIFKTNWEAGKTGLQIYLPDLNWTITEEDYKDNIVNNMITSIPILDALVQRNGYEDDENAYNEKGELIPNRDYVGGTIIIDNKNYGVNEAWIYDKYTKYYPYLNFEYTNWNDETCVRAYSLNTYDTNMNLLVADSFKFTSENVNTAFTFDTLFGDSTSETYISPIEKGASSEYLYEFKGWNTEGVLAYQERDYVTNSNPTDLDYEKALAQAHIDAETKLIIKWDGDSYSVVNDFDFSTVFSDKNRELKIYPTFVAKIRFYNASFYDGLGDNGQGNLIEKKSVRYGDYAIPPTTIPFNLILDPNNKTITNVYPFMQYGERGEDYYIVRDTNYIAQYSTVPQDIHENIAGDDYFSITASGEATLISNYPYEAICIPITCNEIPITQLSIGANKTLRRIYFTDLNEIKTIPASICDGMTSLEYYEFSKLNKLTTIGDYSFRNCVNLVGNILPDSLEEIGFQSFFGCENITFAKLPFYLKKLNQTAFRGCHALTMLDINCPSLTSIPSYCFYDCINLQIKGETFLDSIEEIGQEAFQNCDQLVMNFIDGASGLTTLKLNAFYNTSNLTLASLPSNLVTIEDGALRENSGEKSNLELISFPASITTIGSRAFYGRVFNGLLDLSACINLKDWDSETNTGIHAEAFYMTYGITTIKLPKGSTLTVPADHWGIGSQVEVVYG